MVVFRSLFSAVLVLGFLTRASAEDWTTTDGKTYRHIKVIKTDADAVTILDQDGGALVSLALLPPQLQQEFHYDPAKAKAAAAARENEAQASEQAVAQERTKTQALPPAPAAAGVAPSSVVPAPLGVISSADSSVAAIPSAASPPPSPSAGSQFTLNRGESGASNVSHEKVNPNWKLVWSDEFDGDSIDTSKWSFEIDGKGGGNGEMEYYTDKPENAHLENGNLVITAIKDGTDGEGRTHDFTSARMVTKDKFSWKYGRFEARIKMPKDRGVWPAFWMMPEDSIYGGWARSGEIDIVEEVGDQPNTAYGTLHYGDHWPNNVHTGDKYILPSGDLGDDFHVYAIEWEQGVIRWYIDGKLYQTQTKWYTKAAPFPAPFDQKFFLILNFAVGGAWPGPPSADTVFPQSMLVDYVRVYQPADAP